MSAQWNPNAGVTLSYTHEASITATSGFGGDLSVQNLIDGDLTTGWESDFPFPTRYIAKANQNVFLNGVLFTDISASEDLDIKNTTDANLFSRIGFTGNDNWIRYTLPDSQYIELLSFRIEAPNGNVEVKIKNENGIVTDFATFTSEDTALKRLEYQGIISEIEIISAFPFELIEIAGITTPIYEDIIIDLGKEREIGWLYPAIGSLVPSLEASFSNDNILFEEALFLESKIIFEFPYKVNLSKHYRYVRLRFEIENRDFAKAKMIEMSIYDKGGIYGKMPEDKYSNGKPLKEIMGINGIWGWGQGLTSAFDTNPDLGISLYSKVATHGRNYHDMVWDTNDPDNTPDYSNKGTMNAGGWLDWDTEYQVWKKGNLPVQATLQFLSSIQPQEDWDNLEQASYDYGYEYAKHFGPTHGNGLVDVFEIGNEPWKYDASFYRTILKEMARGAKDADSAFVVLPCALQAADPIAEAGDFKNYMGARLTDQEMQYLDGINGHHYSYALTLENGNIKRAGTFPENRASSFMEVLANIRFRDQNAPDAPIYVSEWGWDSSTDQSTCAHSECVSEYAQAIYGVRGLMILDRLGIERATWFFYADSGNDETTIVFDRSGLTEDKSKNFNLKKSFKAFQALF